MPRCYHVIKARRPQYPCVGGSSDILSDVHRGLSHGNVAEKQASYSGCCEIGTLKDLPMIVLPNPLRLITVV